MLEKLLEQLIAELEFPPLSPKDERGMYVFPVNANLQISLKQMDPGVFFYATLGECPTLKKEDLFIFLMKANLLGQGTGGATIGMDPEEKFLTLSLALPYDINYKTFKETVEDFSNFVDYWREELLQHQKSAEQSVF